MRKEDNRKKEQKVTKEVMDGDEDERVEKREGKMSLEVERKSGRRR